MQLFAAAKMSTCHDWQKLIILLLDKMYIKESIVDNRNTGEMIGFIDLGEINNHLMAFERSLEEADDISPSQNVAKTMLVIMVKGLFTSFRFPYAHFPCMSISGDLLFYPFWEAVYRLERMGFKVLGSTSDGASVNRCMVNLHDRLDELIYEVSNMYSSEKRDLFFFSDPPHLLKTTRNCWASNNRTLWNNGKEILWSHLLNHYERDKGRGTGLALVTKLKYEHLHLTSFSKMRVDLAAQALSETVALALEERGGTEAQETARFVLMFDKFFDALNVRNFTSGTYSRKRFCHPYRHENDERLQWSEDAFLPYLECWEKSVSEREGYDASQKKRMLLSEETLVGVWRTVKAFVEFIRYIFTMPEVKDNRLAFLSNNICQDPLENYFGCQHQRRGTNDNPTVNEFHNNTQALRIVGSFCQGPVRGNCRGGNNKKISDDDLTPLPKKRKLTHHS